MEINIQEDYMVCYISPLGRMGKGYIVWRNHILLVNHLAKLSFKTMFTVFLFVWKKYRGLSSRLSTQLCLLST